MTRKKDLKQPAILFLPKNEAVPIGQATSVLDVALSNEIDLSHSCGGMGSCTTCRVLVESDVALLSPRTELEAEIASSRNFSENERLACQLEPHDGLTVRIPDDRK
jgi:2Fe-2S ferredoxin